MADITNVLVAGYPDIDSADADFEALISSVSRRTVAIDGAILVSHSLDGSVAVRQTGDNLGRKGLGWGGGVGLAVGLFAPPLLASVATGLWLAGWSGSSSIIGWRPRSTTRLARICRQARPGSSPFSTRSSDSACSRPSAAR